MQYNGSYANSNKTEWMNNIIVESQESANTDQIFSYYIW